jgi:hypothetical protein
MKSYTLILIGLAAAAGAVRADDKWDISKMDLSKLPPASDTAGVTYDKDILPIFKSSCMGCHGEQRHRGDLRLDSLEAVLKGGKDGKILVAGDSKNSVLVAAIAQVSDKIAMPPKPRPGRGGPGGPPPDGGAPPPPGAPPPDGGPGAGGPPPGGPGGPGRGGPPRKPLTPEQVGLVRAWIDQGAK